MMHIRSEVSGRSHLVSHQSISLPDNLLFLLVSKATLNKCSPPPRYHYFFLSIFINMSDVENKVDVLMVGTGEYTTGYVGGAAADSDKGAGVVALTMFDLRRRSKVNRVAMCGVSVSSLPLIMEQILSI